MKLSSFKLSTPSFLRKENFHSPSISNPVPKLVNKVKTLTKDIFNKKESKREFFSSSTSYSHTPNSNNQDKYNPYEPSSPSSSSEPIKEDRKEASSSENRSSSPNGSHRNTNTHNAPGTEGSIAGFQGLTKKQAEPYNEILRLMGGINGKKDINDFSPDDMEAYKQAYKKFARSNHPDKLYGLSSMEVDAKTLLFQNATKMHEVFEGKGDLLKRRERADADGFDGSSSSYASHEEHYTSASSMHNGTQASGSQTYVKLSDGTYVPNTPNGYIMKSNGRREYYPSRQTYIKLSNGDYQSVPCQSPPSYTSSRSQYNPSSSRRYIILSNGEYQYY